MRWIKKIIIVMVLTIGSSYVRAAPDVSIVFDGSGSMCGYFTPNNNDRILLNLIQEAMIARGSSSAVDVFALRQKNKSQVSAKTDLLPVSANFQAQAEVLDQQGKKGASDCMPFDGVGSNVELIFNAQTEVSRSNVIALITDAQLQEVDRDVFLRGYEEWANRVIKEGKTPYAGYIMAQANFEGAYYSIAEPDAKLKAAGYLLPKHSRPIALFWFAKGAASLKTVYSLANAFNNSKPVIQQVLPFVQAMAPPFKATEFNTNMTLPQLLADAGKISAIQRYDTDRSENVIRGCLKPVLQADSLLLQVKPLCADNKPIWEGVKTLTYSIQTKPVAASMQTVLDGWTYNSRSLRYEWSLERLFKEGTFKVTLIDAPQDNRTSLLNWSVASDFCPNVSKKNQECLGQLAGKTYQLDILSQQLTNRSKSLSQGLFAFLRDTSFKLKLEYKK